MNPEAVIISRTGIDFPTFLGVALKVLGHSPASAADSSHKRLSPEMRYLSCLAALRDASAGTELNPKLLPHVMVSVFLAADDVDMLDILECTTGMPFVMAETTIRGILAAVITGTLAEWKAAVLAGSSAETPSSVRYAYNKIHGLFCDENINIWTDCRQKPSSDAVTYLLEDKRGR